MKTLEIVVNPAERGLTMVCTRYAGFPRRLKGDYSDQTTITGNGVIAVFYYDDTETMNESEEREIANMFYANEKVDVITVDLDARESVVLSGLVIHTLDFRQ